MEKVYSLIVVLLFLCGVVAGCSTANKEMAANQPPVHNPSKIRLGYQPSMPQAVFLVAKEKGWLEEEFSKDGIAIDMKNLSLVLH